MRLLRKRPAWVSTRICSLSVAWVIPSFSGDQQRADAVLDQIAIRLRRKMRARVLQPIEDLQPALVGDRLEDINLLHLAILLSY